MIALEFSLELTMKSCALLVLLLGICGLGGCIKKPVPVTSSSSQGTSVRV